MKADSGSTTLLVSVVPGLAARLTHRELALLPPERDPFLHDPQAADMVLAANREEEVVLRLGKPPNREHCSGDRSRDAHELRYTDLPWLMNRQLGQRTHPDQTFAALALRPPPSPSLDL